MARLPGKGYKALGVFPFYGDLFRSNFMSRYPFVFCFLLFACSICACHSQSVQSNDQNNTASANEVSAPKIVDVQEAPAVQNDVIQPNEETNAQTAVQETSDSIGEPTDTIANDELKAAENVQETRFDINDHGDLSPEQSQLLDNIQWDEDPEILNAVEAQNEGGHFPFSDEKHLDLFYDSIKDLGGTYIGVGTDQGYLFSGWQKPSLAFLIDYDPWIILIHKLYFAFWNACDDSACLYHYFHDRPAGLEYIAATDDKYGLNKKLPIKVYRTFQRSIARQLKRLDNMEQKNFMNDQETFQFIKKMIQTGRMRTFQANLLGTKAFKSMAETLNRLGAGVTTIYLSNAEQYWGYSKQFKENIIGLPSTGNALILRTSATYPVNSDYRYSIQPVDVFKAWLKHPSCHSVRDTTKRIKAKGPEDFPFVVDDFLPPEEEQTRD